MGSSSGAFWLIVVITPQSESALVRHWHYRNIQKLKILRKMYKSLQWRENVFELGADIFIFSNLVLTNSLFISKNSKKCLFYWNKSKCIYSKTASQYYFEWHCFNIILKAIVLILVEGSFVSILGICLNFKISCLFKTNSNGAFSRIKLNIFYQY